MRYSSNGGPFLCDLSYDFVHAVAQVSSNSVSAVSKTHSPSWNCIRHSKYTSVVFFSKCGDNANQDREMGACICRACHSLQTAVSRLIGRGSPRRGGSGGYGIELKGPAPFLVLAPSISNLLRLDKPSAIRRIVCDISQTPNALSKTNIRWNW
jgi:hypothetical protein